ncbi:hypothetical protein J6590_029078 [Homalodisca vitripennis]|nr:hypothetical protein J6590_029078 [Homalodisca vitripennis]
MARKQITDSAVADLLLQSSRTSCLDCGVSCVSSITLIESDATVTPLWCSGGLYLCYSACSATLTPTGVVPSRYTL